MDIENHVAIVTGASSGIGECTARLLAEKGCHVVVNYRENAAGAEDAVRACAELGAEAVAVRGDVAQDADCRNLAAVAMEKWGRIDALVNNAGITRMAKGGHMDGLSADDFADVFAVNVTGAYMMARAVAPHMTAAGRGTIVNVSSLAGVNGAGSSIAYATSKGALNTMTLSLARSLAPEIRVNSVCPGMVDTRWHRQLLDDEAFEKMRDTVERATPLRHVITAEDVARSILWMIEGADYITGEVMLIDSGMHL
jgi:NAD(P)-dependent dehydrogenase (short-subunit alcohol dehydrogenase family)